MSDRVVIVGAGIIGASTALELSSRGIKAIMLDAGRAAGGCSFGNSGLLSPGHAPLSAPGVCDEYLARRDDPSARGRFAPSGDPKLAAWIEGFGAACSRAAYDRGMDALCALAPLVMPLFREWTGEIRERLGIECDFREEGALAIARTENALEHLRNYAKDLQERGLAAELIDADAVRDLEPAATGEAIGGAFYADWATIEPHRFATGVVNLALEHGAELREGVRVDRIEPGAAVADSGERIEGDAVVVSTGADAAELLDLPMAAALGWHADLRASAGVRRGTVIADRDVILTPMEDRLRVSGLVEITTERPAGVDRSRIEQLLAGPRGVLDGIEGDIASEWVGRRPALPDGLPAIGRVDETLYVATGHARMGLTLGPATGRLIA
jgi:D-amino-acid dehydrogenase